MDKIIECIDAIDMSTSQMQALGLSPDWKEQIKKDEKFLKALSRCVVEHREALLWLARS